MAAGTDFTTERVVQIPTDARYDLVSAAMSVIFMRGDRGKIGPEFVNPIYSWRQKSERFFDCSAAPATNTSYTMRGFATTTTSST
ncbi:hypothetical protein ACFSNO_33340 [Streptomyces cirratus]